MTSKILKYELPLVSWPSIELPKDAFVLCVQEQMNIAYVWAWVDPNETKTIQRRFMLVDTGEEIKEESSEDTRYVGTFKLDGGSYVGHLFEFTK